MHIKKLIYLLALIFIVSGCASTTSSGNPSPPQDYEIDPVFREFYEREGGESLQGPAISPIFSHERFKFQYTIASLLVYDPKGVEDHRNYFAPLGEEMSSLVPPWSEEDISRNLKWPDYTVLEEFAPFYKKLGGKEIVGPALTPPRFNPQKARFEQLFTGLAFYRLAADDPGAIKLLAYGPWKCGDICLYPPLLDNMLLLPEPVAPGFSEWVVDVGIEYTGFAISGLHENNQGFSTQIFENLVLMQDPQYIGGVRQLALPFQLGILPDPPKPASQKRDMVFIPVNGDQGYLVPDRFYDFLQSHGGFENSGLPTGDFKPLNNRVSQQCFEFICLQEDRRIGGQLRVHPAPLGFMFLQSSGGITSQPLATPAVPQITSTQVLPSPETGSQSSGALTIQVWELYPWVSSRKTQEIHVSIFLDNQPVMKIQPELTVFLPDNQQIKQAMSPLGTDGQTSVEIPPLNVLNGTLIPYQVCITTQEGASYCARGDFLVWDAP